ncbi:MAG TPA: hypothetical protein VNW06_02590 [Cytophagaceae bacterium]|jgi:hypothetical protein|nr:hypothetical protein [Cytophagaceae bacterium]
MEKISIETTNLDSKFQDHLNHINNNRIIFSGIFGSGKTTFLKDFFERHSNEFATIHLYPVNYSVADNKDIFELIKVDILIKILQQKVEVNEYKVSQNNLLSHFIAIQL